MTCQRCGTDLRPADAVDSLIGPVHGGRCPRLGPDQTAVLLDAVGDWVASRSASYLASGERAAFRKAGQTVATAEASRHATTRLIEVYMALTRRDGET